MDNNLLKAKESLGELINNKEELNILQTNTKENKRLDIKFNTFITEDLINNYFEIAEEETIKMIEYLNNMGLF